MSISIHPFRERGVSNTCKQKLKSTTDRAIVGVERHLEQHPNDGVRQRLLAKLKGAT